MARPPKPEGERRSEVLRMRVTVAEKAAMEKAAAAKGADFSEWARVTLLAAARRK